MGVYYRLSNGEDIEIRNNDNETEILLFNGSTTLTYENNINTLLNDIIKDVEARYDDLKAEDLVFMYSCYID